MATAVAVTRTKGVPVATELATTPSFPSTIISPPDWLKVEPALFIKFPLMFKVPPVTVSVPLLTNELLFKVHPTVKSPEAIVNVPPEAIVMLLTTSDAELTVTLVPEAILTASPHEGAMPLFQVEAAFQFPLAIDT